MLGKLEDLKYTARKVKVKVEGYRIERLLTKAMSSGLSFRDVTYIDETTVFFMVSGGELPALRKLAKSTYKITILKENGLVPIGSKIRRNKLLPWGVLVFVAYFLLQSMFIKEVVIEGNMTIPETNIRKVVATEGLYEGAFKNFNCKKIEKLLFKDFKNVVWADVAYDGQFAKIRIAENNQYPSRIVDENVPCNIISTKSGYIEEVQAHKGKAKVIKNDFVKKGQVLIAGEVPIEYFSYQPTEEDPEKYYVHAKGRVIARVPYYFTFVMSKTGTRKTATQRMQGWICENIPEKAQIINKSLNFVRKENIIRVYGIIETREEIGIEKEILIDQGNGRIKKNIN